jgi:hypothetical protein
MLHLTIENKAVKKRMMDKTKLQKECKEVKKKEEAWNDANHAYQKALIECRHKVEGLERDRELWLYE